MQAKCIATIHQHTKSLVLLSTNQSAATAHPRDTACSLQKHTHALKKQQPVKANIHLPGMTLKLSETQPAPTTDVSQTTPSGVLFAMPSRGGPSIPPRRPFKRTFSPERPPGRSYSTKSSGRSARGLLQTSPRGKRRRFIL